MEPIVRITLQLPVRTEAAAAARQCVESLQRLIDNRLLENVKLLVSELVTNSLRHGQLTSGDRVEVELVAADDLVRVEVRDPGCGFTASTASPPEEDQTHGWGLYLVDRLAQRWGVERDQDGTDVWFEVTSPDRDGGLTSADRDGVRA